MLRTALSRSPGSPASARSIVRDALQHFPEETVRVAELLVAELVTNVLMHARTALLLEVDVQMPRLRVTVEDSSYQVPRQSPAGEQAGLGLVIVDVLSSGWGWERTPFGKRVWFELGGPVLPVAR